MSLSIDAAINDSCKSQRGQWVRSSRKNEYSSRAAYAVVAGRGRFPSWRKDCLASWYTYFLGVAIFGGMLGRTLEAQSPLPKDLPVQFDIGKMSAPPREYATEVAKAEGVRAFFYEGLPHAGKPTRVFAYYGCPTLPAGAEKRKFPAMVLVHGGGGTAFDRWVRLWNERGYAAIAMDLCGCVPVGTYGNWTRHEMGGPPGWNASFEQLDWPIEDQWTYQAVGAIALAHSLIRSYEEVDGDRIGVTGISWGGYLTCVTAGVDHRFKLAVPVYGCGFLGDNSAWLPQFAAMGNEKSSTWLKQWDPAGYLSHARMPMLWVNGTNDFAYPMDSWRKSYQLTAGADLLCLRVRMKHGHGKDGENPEEIHQFANSLLRNETPLATILQSGVASDRVWASYESLVPIREATLCFTRDLGKWQDRVWEEIPATLDRVHSHVSASIPDGATVFYLNIYDQRDCVISTEHVDRQETKQ